jgi:Cu+-exporting ATPase
VVANANRLRRWRPAPLPTTAPPAVTPRVEVPDEHTPAPRTAPQTRTTQHTATTLETDMNSDHHGRHQADEPLKDPVCGMPVTAESSAEHRELDGVTYYFCSANCAAGFDADPHRYTAQTQQNPS